MMMTKDEKRDNGLRAEEKYKALVETAADAIFVLDLLGRFTFVNPAAERISGYSEEELVGKHFRDLLPAKDIPACLNVFQKAMRGQPTPPIEIEMITKEGGRVPLELLGSPVKRGRRVVEIIGIARDITERKRAEKALQESEQRYRAIFEQAADSLWLVDAETGALVVFNDRAHENLGYTREEFEKLKIPDFEVIECAEEVAKHIEKIVKEGADTFETKHRTKGGEIRDILVSSRAITVGGKNFVQSICRDITERKQAEEEIRTLSQFLDSVIDNANVWLNVLDEKANVVIWNRAAEEISGYSREEVVGHGKIWEWLYPDEEYRDEVFAQAVAIIEKGGEERDAETTIWCKDGQTRIISWNSRNLVDERGKPIGSIALGRDITERKQAEEAAQKRLREITALHKVSEIINATLDLQEVFQRVVEELSEAFGYRLVGIYLLEEQGLRLQSQVGYDTETAIDFIPLERGVIGRVARTGEPAFITDVSQDPDYIRSYPGITSEICVPVKSGEILLGILNAECHEKRPLTDDDLHLLSTLSSHIGVAIENARLYEETQRLATTDGLTGLHNLRYFYETLEKEIQQSERYHHSVSVIILDIDEFKAYNDLYGHLAGDDLLRELAQLMSKVTRQSDTLARYGGEEFAIILPETEIEGAGFLAERFLEQVREHRFSIGDGQAIGQITISLGVATYPDHADGTKALVWAADSALLEAKREGKDRMCVHEPSAAQV